MENANQEFLDSLDLTDQEMEIYIPFILQDLPELGSIPDYIFQLIDKNVASGTIKTIIDFGCGKGAVLVYLARRMDIQGLGMDIIPEFIDSAKQYALEHSVNQQLFFTKGDLLKYIDRKEKYDLVIYGYDSGILGDVYESAVRLQNCIAGRGYLILEIAFTPDSKGRIKGLPTEKELNDQLEKSGLRILDKIFWDREKIKSINSRNNTCIGNRIDQLKIKYPAKADMFDRYMNNQLEECQIIENDMVCSTWILQKQEYEL